ncbi:Ppx/GppA phosphatase family protein [Marinoscillum furvescens]|uniref:Exopolyphosphatase/guanosine-5'-triphosphate, 3'-diphosphate pyrophosphatase n=1 Tax=Marinoscillum furvescens DSM 4134 TaxID=1122208 RepID=A0A3D9L4P7_MARFU|nr:exopolyphosphatase [Marinoscillum furvescens]RED99462.1 exopolyphosphatase/guanosine-5'-triphosphate,3'-diphosphate pyrophosphatase [Marinoscillum furvescens DSM 4134]
MKIAVIDMGTNTFHLLIVEVKKSDFQVVYREKTAVKIGEKGINQGMITPEASIRALKALHRFKEVIEAEDVAHTFATATSAIRNAKNGSELVSRIKEETGIETRVISGLQEAEYIYFGVKKALDIGNKTSLIMDIGGGSIEFIIGTQDKIFWKQSFEIGGQRMVEMFQKHDPILPEEVSALESYLSEKLTELFEAHQKFQPAVLIGSSGTFDTLSDIFRMQREEEKAPDATEYPLTVEAFKEIYAELLVKSRDERLKIPGMIPLRVDMIVVACTLVNFIINKLAIKDIRVSAYALKEGVLLNTLQNFKKESTH